MTTKRIAARRAKLRALAERDAANRCAYCRQAFNGGRFNLFYKARRYQVCSFECMDAFHQVADMRVGR